MKRRKPILGEKLILRRYLRHPSRHEDFEITVTKVGRKYWEAEREYAPGRTIPVGPRLNLDTWQWEGYNHNSNQPVFIAESQQQLDAHEARRDLLKVLQERFRTTHVLEKCSLEKLRKLQALLDDETV